MKRCSWVNLNNPLYVDYHDNEWGVLSYDDNVLFERFSLEILQSGLSFECVLNKREALRKAFDGFKIASVLKYDNQKIEAMLANKNLIRHRGKIEAIINNAKIFKAIINEKGSIMNYLNGFTDGKVIHETGKNKSLLSDTITKDLKMRGMTYIGTTTIYSFLQATGVIDSHDLDCYKSRSI